tara:strand:- start:29 stop:1054 length:1026 start_codon:yes stop_codon:yes gene_type:complete
LNNSTPNLNYGSILFLGSGETASAGRILHDQLFKKLSKKKINVAILETPAGFEPNSRQVALEVSDFFIEKLQNYHPDVKIIPARRRDGDFSTNSEEIISDIKTADHIYLGAGSPTYLVKHLENTLALETLHNQHQNGSSICLTSASSIAFGKWSLPVYEIFKVGLDLYWQQGLDFFSRFNLDLSIIPHWNNNDGGKKIDTSRCYLGKERVDKLLNMLPIESVVLGIDEHTGLLLDFSKQTVNVVGKGSVHLLQAGNEKIYINGDEFQLQDLGNFIMPENKSSVINNHLVKEIPQNIIELAEMRLQSRKNKEWDQADRLRIKLSELGYQIEDNNDGYSVSKI